MKSNDNRRPSASQRILELCGIYGLSVPSGARYLQGVINNTPGDSLSAGGDERSIADMKESNTVEKSALENSVAAS